MKHQRRYPTPPATKDPEMTPGRKDIEEDDDDYEYVSESSKQPFLRFQWTSMICLMKWEGTH